MLEVMRGGCVVFRFAVVLLCFNSCTTSLNWTDDIKISQGKLKGIVSWSNNYNAYLGIPYASVVKRFQEAGPPPSWNGTLFANKGSIKCNQYFTLLNRPIGQEDCLVVNIFTPMSTAGNLVPVMVFVHGGGNYYGSNTDLIYNPKYFVQKDVIMVTINYRLGAFGFLCLNETEAPGNIGLKDQIAALRWIKINIQAFGGDPKAITMFGESAGAASVHYIIYSGKYKGLFEKAILQSGTLLGPNKIDSNPIKSASFVASRMGFNSENSKKLLEIFQNAAADDIIKASHVDPKNQPLKPYIFRPCVENPSNNKKAIITANPRQLLESAELDPNLKIILGYNDKEGIMLAGDYDSKGLKKLNSTLSDLIPDNIILTEESEKNILTDNIRKAYFEKGVNFDSLIDFFSDTSIIYPSVASTNFFLYSDVTVYNYYFKYDSFRNIYKFVSGLPLEHGASHADELFYMFDPMFLQLLPPKGTDLKLIKRITTLWTNFAKTGTPFSDATTTWRRSRRDELNFLQLDKEIEMIPLPNKERFLFWDRVYKKYRNF